MQGSVRIRTDAPNLRQVVTRWQQRHRVGGAVHAADLGTLLTPINISVEALEDLLSALRYGYLEVEVVWREPKLLSAA